MGVAKVGTGLYYRGGRIITVASGRTVTVASGRTVTVARFSACRIGRTITVAQFLYAVAHFFDKFFDDKIVIFTVGYPLYKSHFRRAR